MARCNRKSCAYNDFGRCNLFRKEGLRPNTQMCRWYKLDIFNGVGNHPLFWVAALFIIIALMVTFSI